MLVVNVAILLKCTLKCEIALFDSLLHACCYCVHVHVHVELTSLFVFACSVSKNLSSVTYRAKNNVTIFKKTFVYDGYTNKQVFN